MKIRHPSFVTRGENHTAPSAPVFDVGSCSFFSVRSNINANAKPSTMSPQSFS